MTDGFRLCIINPNSDEAVTDHLRATAVSVLPPGSRVEAMTCPDAPPVIETAEESAAASVSVPKMSQQASRPAAFFVGCFGNPGADRLRRETRLPVVGLGEAALLQASYLTFRFGLVTTLELGIASLWDQVAAACLVDRCVGISAALSDTTVGGDGRSRDQGGAAAETLFDSLERTGRQLVEQGADGLVLACASFSPASARLSEALGVVVCDGARFGPTLAHSLWNAGARPVTV